MSIIPRIKEIVAEIKTLEVEFVTNGKVLVEYLEFTKIEFESLRKQLDAEYGVTIPEEKWARILKPNATVWDLAIIIGKILDFPEP